MRTLVEEFGAQDNFQDKSWQRLRLLAKPLVRYGNPGANPLDGALYGFVPIGYRPMAVGDQYSALNNGAIQAAEVNTTDGQLALFRSLLTGRHSTTTSSSA